MAHKAIIAQVTEVIEIPGADKIHVARVLGENVVVSKDVQVGYIGVLFPVDVQLSEEYCRENNLHRHSHLNADNTKTGFFEDSRRVRAQPFLKVKSEGYFASIDSLNYLNKNGERWDFPVGHQFDEIDGHKICQKYYNEKTRQKMANQGVKKAKVSETPFFAKHVDSDQFKHFADNIPAGALLSFHAKVHGTSARMALTPVTNPLNGFQRLVNKVVPGFFPESEYEYVVGTRNVVLRNEAKDGFHGSEQFRFDVMETVKPYLEKGMTIYGEIAGFVNGKSIMPSHSVSALKDKAYTKKYGDKVTYAYSCKEHEFRFHVYRISYTRENGEQIDMTQKQMEQWCKDRGILTTFEVSPQIVYNGDVDALRAHVEYLTERPDVLTEDYIDPSHPSEGIIVRVDYGNLVPKFYKSKSYAFRVMEGLCEAEDPEDAA